MGFKDVLFCTKWITEVPGENVSKQGQGWAGGLKHLPAVQTLFFLLIIIIQGFKERKARCDPLRPPLSAPMTLTAKCATHGTTTCVMEVIAYKYLNQVTEADLKSTNYLLPYHLV